MAAEAGVAVEGLAAYRRALKSIAVQLPKDLQKQLKAVAETAAARARSNYQRRFQSSRRTRKGTADTIRALATQTGASVAFGGARYPWVPGQEFGSDKFKQFAPWSGPGPGGHGSAGRVIYPAVRDEQEATMTDVQHRLDELARSAYPDP